MHTRTVAHSLRLANLARVALLGPLLGLSQLLAGCSTPQHVVLDRIPNGGQRGPALEGRETQRREFVASEAAALVKNSAGQEDVRYFPRVFVEVIGPATQRVAPPAPTPTPAITTRSTTAATSSRAVTTVFGRSTPSATSSRVGSIATSQRVVASATSVRVEPATSSRVQPTLVTRRSTQVESVSARVWRAAPALDLSKRAFPARIEPGEEVRFQLTIDGLSRVDAAQVDVVDVIDARLEVLDAPGALVREREDGATELTWRDIAAPGAERVALSIVTRHRQRGARRN